MADRRTTLVSLCSPRPASLSAGKAIHSFELQLVLGPGFVPLQICYHDLQTCAKPCRICIFGTKLFDIACF